MGLSKADFSNFCSGQFHNCQFCKLLWIQLWLLQLILCFNFHFGGRIEKKYVWNSMHTEVEEIANDWQTVFMLSKVHDFSVICLWHAKIILKNQSKYYLQTFLIRTFISFHKLDSNSQEPLNWKHMSQYCTLLRFLYLCVYLIDNY